LIMFTCSDVNLE